MSPRVVALVAALGAALALPAQAHALDRVSLQLDPVTLPGKPGWRLTATAPAFGGSGEELFGVTLRRTFLNGRAQETHALRQWLGRARTFTFDGRRGRWRTGGLVGDVVTVNMTAVRSGPERPVPSFLSCKGDFVQVPVRLRGRLVVRTRTRFFGSIRLTRLRGLVTYNRSGPVDCTPTPPAACVPGTDLSASVPAPRQLHGVSASATWLGLAFRDLSSKTDPWYHWMSVQAVDGLFGELPTLGLRAPPGLPITGSGTFSARETRETVDGACVRTEVRGTFVGTFRTRFTGWGTRTLAVETEAALYRIWR